MQADEAAQKEDDDEKGWNLEDETGFDDEEDDGVPAATATPQPKQEDAMDLAEGGDEIDPLDAFMAENDAQVEPVKTEEESAAPKGTVSHMADC